MKIVSTLLLLCGSNLFMTWAWYGHLKKSGAATGSSLLMIVLISWGIAFFEYCLMIPANRIGFSAGMSLAQLKITQEVITLCVFVPFAVYYMGEKWRLDYFWAFICILGAVFFVNRQELMA